MIRKQPELKKTNNARTSQFTSFAYSISISQLVLNSTTLLFMVALCNRADHYIFAL